ncbi:conserved Plasmodium protein, unknown function [Plasmodium gallinaceum]|uniref:Uncharacterized protein n=1 Tax=Plasmodium gallinaceum TaxID=5849 RepID=A0A1J1H2I2_PLAGA|nr:conserved Plasmodium protein, unknown function [Plasmodium gallinaceum]CRG97542.1 conserved Plasmodium protein, unknown function [Plasmodium gallinaceum]
MLLLIIYALIRIKMFFLKNRCLFMFSEFINKTYLSCNIIKSNKIKIKYFTSLKSIYDYDSSHENVDFNNKLKNTNECNTSFLAYNSKLNNESLKSTIFIDNMEDLKNYFEKHFNEMKNYDYIHFLFKIYEIIFYNFYKNYEHSENFKLNNPHFVYLSFIQYLDNCLKKNNSVESTKMCYENNEVILRKNCNNENISNYIEEKERNNEKNNIKNNIDKNYSSNYTMNNRPLFNEPSSNYNTLEKMNIKITNDESKNTESFNSDYYIYNNNKTNYIRNSHLEENSCDKNNYMNKINLNTLMKIYCNYVIYLENVNIKKESWNEYISSFLTKRHMEFYTELLNTIYKKLFFFSCNDIINFLYILKRINISSMKDIYILVENTILQNLKFLDEEYLIRVGYIYLNNSNKKKNINYINRYNSKNFIETYINFVQSKIKSMDNQNFIKLLEFISNNNYKHIHFYRECKNEVYKRYNNFTDEQIMKLFYLYSQNINASDKILMHNFLNSIVDMFSDNLIEQKNIVKIQINKLNKIDDENESHKINKLNEKIEPNKNELKKESKELNIPIYVILNGIWANAKYFKDYPFLLKKCEMIILKNFKNFGSSTISMLIWAYSTVENKNNDLCFNNNLYLKLKERALMLYKFMTPKQLSNSLLGLSTTLGRTINNEGDVNIDYHEEIEKYLLEKEKGIIEKEKDIEKENKKNYKNFTFLNFFTSEDLANMCYSYSLVRCGSKELHTLLQSALLNKLNDLSPQNISKIAYAYGNLYFFSSYTLLSSLQYEILQRIHQFSHYEICDILWCYCINKFFDANFWKCMLHVINIEKINDPRCSLLYSSLSYVNLINSSILDSYNVLRIFNFLREYYWDFQITEYPHNFANDVIETLENENDLILSKKDQLNASSEKNMFHYIQKLFDYEGFLIDIYFEYKNQKYAIFLYTSLNTTSDGSPVGENILKTRFIKKKKFKPIHLLFNIWKNYNQNKINLIYSQL